MAAYPVDPWAPIPHWRRRQRARRLRHQLLRRLRMHRDTAATVAAATALAAAGLILDAPLCVALALTLPWAAAPAPRRRGR